MTHDNDYNIGDVIKYRHRPVSGEGYPNVGIVVNVRGQFDVDVWWVENNKTYRYNCQYMLEQWLEKL